jgi:hypothetical protein
MILLANVSSVGNFEFEMMTVDNRMLAEMDGI